MECEATQIDIRRNRATSVIYSLMVNAHRFVSVRFSGAMEEHLIMSCKPIDRNPGKLLPQH